MTLPAITLLALIAGVQSQERLFFNNPLVTVTRTTSTTTTSTLVPTCFELVKTTACARKKKQLAFLVDPFDYYHGAAVLPQPVIQIQQSVAPVIPEYRFLPPVSNGFFNYFQQTPVEQEQMKPVIDPSLSEKADGQARFFGTSLVKFTYLTSTVTVPTVASTTQTYQVNCVASGQANPSPTCIIRITFPPVPAGSTLQQYCQTLADAAKMALAECKYASRRRRQSGNSSSRVVVGFDQKPGGDPPSRQAIASNIVSACSNKKSCTIGGVTFSLDAVEVPGFSNILAAGGSSSTYASTK